VEQCKESAMMYAALFEHFSCRHVLLAQSEEHCKHIHQLMDFLFVKQYCALFRPDSQSNRRASREVVVQGTLPTWTASESESQLPEVAEVLRIECIEAQSSKATEKTVCAFTVVSHRLLIKHMMISLIICTFCHVLTNSVT
jgi:hypothetical protein